MKGFKEFVLKGNLVELAVAFIMAAAFATVVTALVDVIMSIISKFGGQPNFDEVAIADVVVGPFITALIAFLILAAVVYFLIVLPYNNAVERFQRKDEEETVTPDEVLLLQEIRDLLQQRNTQV